MTADQTTNADDLLNDLSGDDDSLSDVFDMSWSTILGRSLSCPAEQSVDEDRAAQSDVESRRRRVDVATGSGSESGTQPAVDNDVELDELIRACADTDPGMLDDLGDFALDVDGSDSLDLTIYGVGLRPPDWWSSLGDCFDSGSGYTASGGGDSTALNTPSPRPATLEVQEAGQRSQQQPHPWAENRDSMTLPSLHSSLEVLGSLAGGPPTSFNSDVADDF